jgi:hypothetical protein
VLPILRIYSLNLCRPRNDDSYWVWLPIELILNGVGLDCSHWAHPCLLAERLSLKPGSFIGRHIRNGVHAFISLFMRFRVGVPTYIFLVRIDIDVSDIVSRGLIKYWRSTESSHTYRDVVPMHKSELSISAPIRTPCQGTDVCTIFYTTL